MIVMLNADFIIFWLLSGLEKAKIASNQSGWQIILENHFLQKQKFENNKGCFPKKNIDKFLFGSP